MDKRGAHRSQCILSCIRMFIFNLGPGSQTDSPAKFSVWTMFIKVGLVGWLLFTLIYLSTFLWVCNIHSGGGGGDVTVDWRLLSGVVSSCNSKSWKTCKNVKQETLKGYFSLFSLLLYIRILQTLQLLAKKQQSTITIITKKIWYCIYSTAHTLTSPWTPFGAGT